MDERKVRIAIEEGSYNSNRYGRPWIAEVVDWPVGGHPELEFGAYVGSDAGGVLEMLVAPGTVIRWGQKDNRGKNTRREWGVARPDGSVDPLDPAEAREVFDQQGVSVDALKAEENYLVERLAEVREMLAARTSDVGGQ